MDKAVLISIRPKWVELIASGEKTVEVRKTRPNLDTPFKTYIYCTKPSFEHEDFFVIDAGTEHCRSFYGGGKVLGEFVCDEIVPFDSAFDEWAHAVAPGGSTIDSIGWDRFLEIAHNGACLTDEDINAYWPEDVNAQMWHISDLNVYDNPKELSEFWVKCEKRECKDTCPYYKKLMCVPIAKKHKLGRAPQSWMYVEEFT